MTGSMVISAIGLGLTVLGSLFAVHHSLSTKLARIEATIQHIQTSETEQWRHINELNQNVAKIEGKLNGGS